MTFQSISWLVSHNDFLLWIKVFPRETIGSSYCPSINRKYQIQFFHHVLLFQTFPLTPLLQSTQNRFSTLHSPHQIEHIRIILLHFEHCLRPFHKPVSGISTQQRKCSNVQESAKRLGNRLYSVLLVTLNNSFLSKWTTSIETLLVLTESFDLL